MTKAKHPMQPIVWDGNVVRFKTNQIVRFLLDWASERGMSMNELARMGNKFDKEDWNQLAQLIGYSVSGYGDLSYASPKTVREADAIVEGMIAKRKRKKPA